MILPSPPPLHHRERLLNVIGDRKMIAVLEPRSNTTMARVCEQIAPALAEADEVNFYQPADVDWALADVAAQCRAPARW